MFIGEICCSAPESAPRLQKGAYALGVLARGATISLTLRPPSGYPKVAVGEVRARAFLEHAPCERAAARVLLRRAAVVGALELGVAVRLGCLRLSGGVRATVSVTARVG